MPTGDLMCFGCNNWKVHCTCQVSHGYQGYGPGFDPTSGYPLKTEVVPKPPSGKITLEELANFTRAPKPHKCPVCEGSGQLEVPIGYGSMAVGFNKISCHGCNGQGWVAV